VINLCVFSCSAFLAAVLGTNSEAKHFPGISLISIVVIVPQRRKMRGGSCLLSHASQIGGPLTGIYAPGTSSLRPTSSMSTLTSGFSANGRATTKPEEPHRTILLELALSLLMTARAAIRRSVLSFYGNQGANNLTTTAYRREHRNQVAFRRNGTGMGFSLTADSEHNAASEFSTTDLESACKSTAEVLSRLTIAAIRSGPK
jgi:hypothetical protein